MIKLQRKHKKLLGTVFKISVSALLFYFVSIKISFSQIFLLIRESNALLLLLSIVLLLLSQIVSSYRLNVFFKSQNYHISEKKNMKLYFIGMFYNFFIPGGVGGDAYKVFKLNKDYGWQVKKLTAAMFVDRFSGLVIITVLMLLMLSQLEVDLITIPTYLFYLCLVFLAVLVVSVSYLLINKFFNSFKKSFIITLKHSVLVQLLQLGSICCFVLNFDVLDDTISYLLVFLISVVLSIISFAGIGVREFVFYKAADLLHYSKDTSVAIGLLFTFITAIISLVGIVFQFNKIKTN